MEHTRLTDNGRQLRGVDPVINSMKHGHSNGQIRQDGAHVIEQVLAQVQPKLEHETVVCGT